MELTKWLLGEVLDNYDYLRKPLSSIQRALFKGEYPYYGAQGIIDYVADYRCEGEFLLVAEDGENLSSRNVPIAQIAKGKYWVNNHAHIVRNNKHSDLQYICYLLNNLDIAGYVTGSAQPKLSQGSLNKIKIQLPSLSTQQKISSILSSYDRLIENNTRRIRLLEQMAENLYKEWFVRFRFPGHEKVEMVNGLPKGWERTNLGKYSNISTGKCNREDAEDDGKYPLFDRSQETKKSNHWIKDCEAIIVPGEGTSFIPRYYKGKFNLHQRCYCIEPTIEDIGFYLFHSVMLNRKYFLSVATGATVPSLRQNNFTRMKLIIAELYLVRKYNKIATTLALQINKLAQQNTHLTRQRDLLLPRLMSGKLEVKP